MSIISTDPREISRDLIQSVEATLGPLMPGDERRIFVDQLAYALAVQNSAAVTAWAQNDPAKAEGDNLTALGQRIDVYRTSGAPARISMSVNASDPMASVPVGFRFTLGGVSWSMTAAASSAQSGEAQADETTPTAAETAAQNALIGSMIATPTTALPAGITSLYTSARLGGPYIQRATADDREDDAVYRARVIAYQHRSFDWREIARSIVPDASDIYAYLAAPGQVRIVVVKRDADGWTRSLDPIENSSLSLQLAASADRPLGDQVAAVIADVLPVSIALEATIRRGYLPQVTQAAADAIAQWCYDSAGHLGGEVDSGDLVRIIDALDGVRWVNVASMSVGGLTPVGSPPHVTLTENQAARCTPQTITLTITEQ